MNREDVVQEDSEPLWGDVALGDTVEAKRDGTTVRGKVAAFSRNLSGDLFVILPGAIELRVQGPDAWTLVELICKKLPTAFGSRIRYEDGTEWVRTHWVWTPSDGGSGRLHEKMERGWTLMHDPKEGQS